MAKGLPRSAPRRRDAGSTRAGLPPESLLALGHPAPTGSGEAAPNLHTMERAEHLLGSAELRLDSPQLLVSLGESSVYGGVVNKKLNLLELHFLHEEEVSCQLCLPRPSGAVP